MSTPDRARGLAGTRTPCVHWPNEVDMKGIATRGGGGARGRGEVRLRARRGIEVFKWRGWRGGGDGTWAGRRDGYAYAILHDLFFTEVKNFRVSPRLNGVLPPPPPSPPHPRVYVYPPYIFFLLGFSLFFITFGQPFTTHILTL